MSPDMPPPVMPNTSFKGFGDGDFALFLKDIGRTLEGHPAYRMGVPDWVPDAKRLYEHSDLLAEAISAYNRDKSKEPEKNAERKRAEQAINFAVQFLMMYAIHHKDPSALDIGLEAKEKKYNKDARRVPPAKMEKLEIHEVQDEKGDETDRLLIVIGKLPDRGSAEIQYTDNPDDPSSWKTFCHLHECRSFVPKGPLSSVKKYFFRGQYETAGGNGPWSEIIKHVVL